MKRTVPLHEFMPYGAPDLLVAARPNLSRALALSSALAVGLGVSLSALAPQFVPERVIPIPIPPVIIMPDVIKILTPPDQGRAPRVDPTPPREGRFEPVEQAPPLAPDGPIDYERIADQLRLPGEGTGPDVVLPPDIAPVDPDLPAIYVEVLPFAAIKVMPDYPELARQAMVEGRVIVLVLVGRDGRVREARVDVNHSVPMLDQAALVAARQWVFSPALVNDHPVAVWTAIPFRFTLSE